MGKPLFLKPIVKEASGTTVLTPNTNMWQDEIVQFILGSLPYLQPYNMRVSMEDVNPETGSMFARVYITPKVQRPGEEQRMVAIPVIATNRKMSPVDIMAVDGGWQPLTETRINNVFPANEFGDIADQASAPISPSMQQQIQSPMQNMGGDSSGTIKTSSLSEEILGSITEKNYEGFMKEACDKSFLMCAAKSDYLQEYVCKVEGIPTCMEKIAFDTEQDIDPWCFQLSKAGTSYIVKTAHPAAYAPIIHHISASEFSELDKHVKEAVLKKGYCTVTNTEVVEQPSNDVPNVISIDGLSKCAVYNSDNEATKCTTIPAMRVDGSKAGLLCITDESYSVQEKCAGYPLEDFTSDDALAINHGQQNAFDVTPVGHGTFIMRHGDTVLATEPLTVKYAYEDKEGIRYMCTSDSGIACNVRGFDKLASCIFTSDTNGRNVFCPSDYQFVPLDKSAETKFVTSPSIVKQAYLAEQNMIKVSGSGTHYSVEGDAVLAIPPEDRLNVSRPEANFVLTMAGMNQPDIEEALNKSAKHSVNINVPFVVESTENLQKRAEMIDQIHAEWFSRIKNHPGHSLVKIAAQAVQDPKTLDSLLSLGFLTPQNIETFMNYIPDLEASLKKLAELLFAARIGLNSNETDLKTCMNTLDSIITDLSYMNNEARDQMSQLQADPSMAALPQQSRPMPQQAPQGAAQQNMGQQPVQ